MTIEYRYQRKAAPSVDDSGSLHGRAIVFNSWTTIGNPKYGGFREKVSPSAVRKSLKDGDLVLLDNHDTGRPLARMSAGTLKPHHSAAGLDWDAKPPNTTYAKDVIANAKARNYGGCSFGFEVIRDRWTDDDGREASPLDGSQRELLEIKLHEISVCTFPAYDGTSVGSRDVIRSARGLLDERANAYDTMKKTGDEVSGTFGSGAISDADDDDTASGGSDSEDMAECWDPDGDGDNDLTPEGDTDHSHWSADGKQLLPVPGKPLNGMTATMTGAIGSPSRAKDSSKPYGDVSYADPGYQKDGKKRYPLDTKNHVKAAWSYINQKDNASQYTASQLASIKSKIKAALKKFGVNVSNETKTAEWEALADFREMTEGYEPGDEQFLGPEGFIKNEDACELARWIKEAVTPEQRTACINMAVDLNLPDLLPDHWGPDGQIGANKSEETVRDMDYIYEKALQLPPSGDVLDILKRAEPYLSNETRKDAAERANSDPGPGPVETTLTMEERRKQMEELQKHRYEMDRLNRDKQ